MRLPTSARPREAAQSASGSMYPCEEQYTASFDCSADLRSVVAAPLVYPPDKAGALNSSSTSSSNASSSDTRDVRDTNHTLVRAHGAPNAWCNAQASEVSDTGSRRRAMVEAGERLVAALAEHGDTREMIEALDPVRDQCGEVMWSMRPSQPHHALGKGAPAAPCEDERAATMRALKLEELPDNPDIDSILRLLCTLYGAPCSAISLVTSDTCIIKQACGATPGVRPWKIAYCPWVMVTPKPDLLVLEDLTKDVRFADSYWCENGMRTYVAAPMLASNGHRMGSLCFFSPDVIHVDSGKCRLLANFAEMAARHLEKHAQLQTLLKKNADVQQAYHKMLRSLDAIDSPVVFVDTGREEWAMLYVTPAFCSAAGISRDAATSCSLRELLLPPGNADRFWSAMEGLRASGRAFTIKGVRLSLSGEQDSRMWNLSFRPADRDTVDDHTLPVGVPNLFAHVSHGQRGRLYFATLSEVSPDRIRDRELHRTDPVLRRLRAGGAGKPGGVTLRQLLGRGAHAAVYYGTWFGSEVAVKVMERSDMSGDEWEQAMTELEVGREIVHPLLVRTLSYQVIKREPTSPDSASDFSDRDCLPSDSTIFKQVSADWASAVHCLPRNSPGSSFSSDASLGSKPLLRSISFPTHVEDVQCVTPAAFNSAPCNIVEDITGRNMSTIAEEDAAVWLIMEYCSQGCLQDAIDKGLLRTGPSFYRDQPHRLKLQATALEVASAMRYLHRHRVVHGDLTSYNVLLATGGSQVDNAGRGWFCKVADFSCSQKLGPAELLRVNSYGSVSYMAPEVLQHGIVSRAADVYSFGVLMWQMWCSAHPWAGLRHVQIIHAVVVERQMLEFPRGTWAEYEALARRCMAYEARARPTFDEVCAALEEMRAAEEDGVGSF